jgi:hypothetical protein
VSFSALSIKTKVCAFRLGIRAYSFNRDLAESREASPVIVRFVDQHLGKWQDG